LGLFGGDLSTFWKMRTQCGHGNLLNYLFIVQIDQLREISRINDKTANQISESVILYEKRIPIDTAKFEQLNQYFIGEMENKLRKVKLPSKGLKWYIAMWIITLASAFLAGYFIHEYRGWKEKAMYWYQQYEEIKKAQK